MMATLIKRKKSKRLVKEINPKNNYIELDDLNRLLLEGVSLDQLKELERAWSGTSICVKDYINFLDVTKSLKFEGDRVRIRKNAQD